MDVVHSSLLKLYFMYCRFLKGLEIIYIYINYINIGTVVVLGQVVILNQNPALMAKYAYTDRN